ncbi:MAG: UDP-N-acetylmuramoyl-tripeptide--D-alanyl-D-alanine ligase [Acidobacteriota bacterium]
MPFRFERWHFWFRQVFFARLLGLLGPVLYWAAYAWRRLLRGTTFIAITGSLGKTTAKDCLAAILGDHYSTFRTVGTQNARRLLSLNLLRVRPWHRFAVLEVATREPGTLAPASSQVRPDVAIVLGAAPTHIRNYASLDEIAHEKMQILQGLKPGGLVILNGDDARLNAFPVDPRFRVEKFGTGSGLQLRASSISSRWPDRLSFLAIDGDTSAEVRTRMVGTHWVPSVLAAMLAARHCGIDLRRSAEVLQNVPPSRGKMEPVLLPGGAVVIRDEYNASPRSYDAALKVLEQARAGRRIAVFGDVSDTNDKTMRRLRRLGQRAAEVCEFALFVGESGHHSRYGALQGGLPESSVFCCTLPEEAASFLAGELRPGDVVLVKGWTSQHLERLTFAQVGAVACWTAHCRKTIQCDTCWKLGVSSAERAKLKPAQTLLSSPAGTGRSSGPPGLSGAIGSKTRTPSSAERIELDE